MDNRILIAYFSHEGEAYVGGNIVELTIGNTKVAAQMIEKLTGGDLFRIETVKPYPHNYMATIELAKEEKSTNSRPELNGVVPNMADYDTIILGYPNWWGTMPMAVWGFLESYDFYGKTILPLCTHEGSGMGQSEADIKKLCPTAKLGKGLAATGGSVLSAQPAIEKWLQKANII